MITLEEYYMGRDEEWPPNQDQIDNALKMVEALSLLEEACEFPLIITSGYRPTEINCFVAGASRGSLHAQCAAADLRDTNKKLSTFCLKNLEILEEIGLWMEDPKSAKDHVHLQVYPPKSGKRVFKA